MNFGALTSDSFPQCPATRMRTQYVNIWTAFWRSKMAGASDPLEDMLFSEVDEKAVSDLVGSLESQLVGQSNPAAPHTDTRSAGSTGAANHHLGRALPAQVGTTLEQQQQGQHKAGVNQEPNSKEISSEKTPCSVNSIQPFEEASITSGTGVNVSSGLQSHGASNITTLSASALVTLPPPLASLNPANRAGAAPLANSASPAASSSLTAAPNTTTAPDASASQSAVTLAGRGTPTIALQRLPSHIMASIAQNGNGTTVSALVQQSPRTVPPAAVTEVVNDGKSAEAGENKSDTTEQSKMIMPSPPVVVNSSVNTVVSPVPAVNPTTSHQQSPVANSVPAVSSPATLTAVGKPTLNIAAQPAATTVGMIRPGTPAPSPAMATPTQPQQLRAAQRIVAPQLIVRHPQQPTTIQLPPGFTIPQGMVLVRTEMGQLVMVPQQALAQAQAQAQAHNSISPRPVTPTTATTFRVATTQVCPAVPLLYLWVPADGASFCSEMQENVKKCKNFLATLIKLASHNSPSPETSRNVKALVQDLLDAKIEPEEFTSRLQSELKSSPQPYLVPFLKKSLPALRLSLLNSQQSLTQPPQVKPAAGRPVITAPLCSFLILFLLLPGVVGKGPVIPASKSPVGFSAQVSANLKNKLNDPGGGSFRDDDDINDVASMAGVNLSEESARILATNSELVGTQIRSCKDEAFLPTGTLHRRILETGMGFTEGPAAKSHSIKQKVTGQHSGGWSQSTDVRSQLKFFEQLERIEKQRKDEQEREILLKAAKSRSRQEDPEQARLKQRAKEMQQQELAQMRQRDANLTALAAIGPRKKRKLDSPGAASSGTEVSGCSTGSPAGFSAPAASSRQHSRQRITRVNLRDLIFYMEQERETARSLLLYRALLK
uniref:Si:dkey-219c3.2 n=1 Tax=Paramormyrops kingsleyae TaxID=1676925 RepID=A0A3B3RMI0_9TELE